MHSRSPRLAVPASAARDERYASDLKMPGTARKFSRAAIADQSVNSPVDSARTAPVVVTAGPTEGARLVDDERALLRFGTTAQD
jgi:hypothetical protein